jgi:hypothetical protein
MSKMSAERQAIYRANREIAGSQGNGERRLNTWVSSAAYYALKRLSKLNDVSQREMLERLVLIEDDNIIAALTIDTPEWDDYFFTKK